MTWIDIGARELGDVYKELRERLRHNEALEEKIEYFQISSSTQSLGANRHREITPKLFKWTACYAVTGGSEGHYIHVDLILDSPDSYRQVYPLFTGKTFSGIAAAWEIAAFCAEELGA